MTRSDQSPRRGRTSWPTLAHLRRYRASILLALALAACSSPEPTVIDGSSPEAFARTVEAARRDLGVRDRLDFDRALASVRTRRFGAEDPDALARLSFDRMTAADVVADFRARQR